MTKPANKKVLIFLLMVVTALLTATYAQAGSTTVQVALNRIAYDQGSKVTVKAIGKNQNGWLDTKRLGNAVVTITDSSGRVLANNLKMQKDAVTGLMYYSYQLSGTALKGNWTASVKINEVTGSTGTGSATFAVKGKVPNHSSFFNSYQGTKTCLTCHKKQAADMFSSLHYQFRGDTSETIELAGQTVSKLGGINDFCISPDANWLGIATRLDGKINNKFGCGYCHPGFRKPSNVLSDTELENIDCLICHSPTYDRVVEKSADGTLKMVPNPAIDIQAAAKNIARPGRAECMRCHQNSGGGDNYKRGDLESTIKNCTQSYDVHMGTDGQNFSCLDCHKTTNHKVAGRGTDMRAVDSSFEMSCATCHTEVPHRSYNTNFGDLNRHTEKVFCTVCHIPTFAKSVPTDMVRDWSQLEVDSTKQLYDPKITFATNVKPQYAWFNGLSHFYPFKTPTIPDSRGIQKMSWPDGSITDPKAKIYPFKVHRAYQPMETSTRELLALRNVFAFVEGDIDKAIREGAKAAGQTYSNHTFVPTERYMGIFHAVGPKSTALNCINCHADQSRMPFKQLGYATRGSTTQLCGICHSYKTYDFYAVHNKHRDRVNCNTCHGAGAPLKAAKTQLCSTCHRSRTANTSLIHSKHVDDKNYDCSVCHNFVSGSGPDRNLPQIQVQDQTQVSVDTGAPLKATKTQLCSQCHKAKSASISKIHSKHVEDKGFACEVCHSQVSGNYEKNLKPDQKHKQSREQEIERD